MFHSIADYDIHGYEVMLWSNDIIDASEYNFIASIEQTANTINFQRKQPII